MRCVCGRTREITKKIAYERSSDQAWRVFLSRRNRIQSVVVVVIFEFETDSAQKDRYFDLAAVLRDEVEKIDGFISVERFENVHKPGCFVSLSTWDNMESARAWKQHVEHAAAQEEAKTKHIFKHYRIRVAEVMRDYGSVHTADK